MTKYPIVDLGPDTSELESLETCIHNCALFFGGAVFGALLVVIFICAAL